MKTKGLAGDQLRDAYIARVERDVMESSIWSHEGRHAIDKKYGHWITSPELEFRAKLSQLQFAPSPLHAIVDIAGSGNPEFGDTPHGKANRRIAQALFDWMKAHNAQINGLDASKPLMLQLDKLTDDQVRAFTFIRPDVVPRCIDNIPNWCSPGRGIDQPIQLCP